MKKVDGEGLLCRENHPFRWTPWPEGDVCAAAAAVLTVLMMVVVVTVLMVVWLFVFRKGEKKKMCVLAGWLVPGFCFAIFFFLSLQCACFLKTATASGSEDFFCDHLD